MSELKNRMEEALAYRKSLEKNPADISQSGLAKACGVRPPSVSDWFSGKTKSLRGETALKAARYLRVRPEWLASGLGPMALDLSELISTGLDGFKPTISFEAIDREMRKHVVVEEGKFYFVNPKNGERIELLPERHFSLGGSSRVFSESVQDLPATRRRTIANLITEQIVEGPSDDLSSQIDALAPGVLQSLSTPWRAAAMVMFDSLQREGTLNGLNGEAFAALVDHVLQAKPARK